MNESWSMVEVDVYKARRMKSQGLCKDDRDTLCEMIYARSPERQRKFITAERYVAHMDQLVYGLRNVTGDRRVKRSGRDPHTQAADAAVWDLAKAKGWCESNRHQMWSSMCRRSPERQREFSKEDHYVAFMEASYRRMK